MACYLASVTVICEHRAPALEGHGQTSSFAYVQTAKKLSVSRDLLGP